MKEKSVKECLEERLIKLLNRFILKSRQFTDRYCFPDGLVDIMKIGLYTDDIPEEIIFSNKLSYDYDYYAFTKSTKTLHAIKILLSDKNYNFNEDVMILVRSIFENHIMSRYFREHIDKEDRKKNIVQEFIRNPLGISLSHYRIENKFIKDSQGTVLGKLTGPSNYKLGEENEYYTNFYSFLSNFAHCSFKNLDCYFERVGFSYHKNSYRFEAILFTIFVFTKILEGVATVEGENFINFKEEKEYYNLVYDSLEWQEESFNYLIEKYDLLEVDHTAKSIHMYLNEGDIKQKNNNIKRMLLKMKESLYEEIGSLKKDKRDEYGKYIRHYPQYN